MGKTVVILGAGWAGLPLAHKLLKYTVPKMSDLKVILVSPNSHFFWNVAATRGVIPGEIPDNDLFIPIEPAFKQYCSENFEFVLGSAKAIEPTTNVVEIQLSNASLRVTYDQLVIATGSRVASNLPFKPIGSHEETLSAWHGLQSKVKDAKSIVVSGGGPTGLEVAGELAARYKGSKDITLVTSGDAPLAAGSASVRATTTSDLKKLGMKLITNNRVVGAQEDPASHQTTITMSNAAPLKADLYLPLHGMTVNATFIPEKLLDEAGNLNLRSDMRASGNENIWGIGDIGNLEPKQLTVTDNQIIHLAATLDGVLTGRGQQEPYQPEGKTMLFISLGRKHATGQIGNWRLPGFMVNYVKGRKLFVDTAKGYVGGEYLRHTKM